MAKKQFEAKPGEREQIARDRKTLVKGAVLAAGGLAGIYAVLRRGSGGVVGQAPYVAPVKAGPLRKGDALLRNAQRRAGGDAGKALARQMKAADVRAKRGWYAMRPVSSKRMSRLKPQDRQAYAELKQASTVGKAIIPEAQRAQMTSREVFREDRAVRYRQREKLARLRERKNFAAKEEGRDKLSKARDVAIIAGTGAVGGGAIAGGIAAQRVARKADSALGYASSGIVRTARKVREEVTPDAVARAGLRQVKKKARKVAGEYFPTFAKVGRVLRKRVLSAPADELIEFGGTQQYREAGTNVYADPLKAAAGFQRVYYRKDAAGNPIIEDLPVGHAQTIRAALRKGEKINRVATRGGRLAKDVVDTVAGKARGKDAAGRTKKREWEKSWFRDAARKTVAAGALLGGAAYLRKNPAARRKVQRTYNKGADFVNRRVPDLVPRMLSTPANDLFEFGDGKRFTKVVKNPETGRTRTVRYGQAGEAADGGDRIRPGTKKGDAYCARSAKIPGDWKDDPNSPNNLSRKKWKCRGDKSMRSDFATPADGLIDFARIPVTPRVISQTGWLGKPQGHAKWVKQVGSVHVKDGKTPDMIAAQGRRIRIKQTDEALKKAGTYVDGISDADFNKRLGRELRKKRSRLIIADAAESYGSRRLPKPNLDLDLATPADRLIGFDAVAAYEGWDIRDPRGRSARVFAPGSRRRVRREKEWHEKAGNERKLWKAGVAAAAIAAGAGGVAIGRRFPRKKLTQAVPPGPAKKVVPFPASRVS